MGMSVNLKIFVQKRDVPLFLSLFILTVAGSTWAVNHNLDRMLEYVSYAVLLMDISLNFIRSRIIENKWKRITLFCLVTLLFSLGLCVQQMPFGKLFPLLMTMIAISVSSLLSESYLDSYHRIKIASDAIIWGNIVALALSVLFGYTVIQMHSEMNIFAFSGGIYIKNYFGADMVIILIGYYLAERKSPKKSQIIIIAITALFLLLSNSRGALIMFAVFITTVQFTVVRRITKHQRKLFTVTALLLYAVIFVILFQEIALNSVNYMMRIKGFENYINHPDTNITMLFVGNARELYMSSLDYVTQFRKLYGWDGTAEFALLDILIKNGIIGLIGYIVIFYIFIHTFLKSENWEHKSAGIAIAAMILASMLVETFIQTIHSPVGIYCYLVMGGIMGMCNHEETEKGSTRITVMGL